MQKENVVQPFIFLDKSVPVTPTENESSDIIARITLEFRSTKLDFSFTRKKKKNKRG